MWSEIARTVVKRRDQQVVLGIARRRTPRAAKPAPASPAGSGIEDAPNSRAA